MARGWESKSVESQQEEAVRDRVPKRALTGEQRAAAQRQQTLELARASAAAELGRAISPHHRTMLEQAIATIDQQLAQLKG